MTILVAGASGRLGVLVEILLTRGHAVRAMGRRLDSPDAECAIDVDLPLQQAAITDVAMIAALAIERPDEFDGQWIRVASDELTATDAAKRSRRVTGRPFAAHRVDMGELGAGLQSLFASLTHTGHNVDIPGLRGRYPRVGWQT